MQKLVQYLSFLKGGTEPENAIDELNRALASGYEIVSITNTSFKEDKEGILTQVVVNKRDGIELSRKVNADKDEFIKASENIDITGKVAKMTDFSFEKLFVE